ncbi:hypothetical protein [Photorhabdus australis]|uniref:hypothetical protein n=1 Tax=Photorhabdus australis TaxID=286156 RepID=UPI000B1F51B6|nr:hypothetical protein [Photorhabdus australis]
MAPIMRKNQLKQQKEKGQVADMNENIKLHLLENKDDLIEGTFYYSLFEESIFCSNLMTEFIEIAEFFLSYNNDLEIKQLLEWVISCIEQCFLSHHDENDYYYIKNYSIDIENKWKDIWKPKLDYLLDIKRS